MSFVKLRRFPSTLLSDFYHERVLDFVKCFFAFIEMMVSFFIFFFI